MADRDDKISFFTSRLPPEIRTEIYQHLLLAKNARLYVDDLDRVVAPLVQHSG